jgi:hypothetical protein
MNILCLEVIQHRPKVWPIYPALYNFVPHCPALCGIALAHGPALCRVARHYTYSFISRRIRNDIRKYIRAWIRDLDRIFGEKKQRSKISWHCLFKTSYSGKLRWILMLKTLFSLVKKQELWQSVYLKLTEYLWGTFLMLPLLPTECTVWSP